MAAAYAGVRHVGDPHEPKQRHPPLDRRPLLAVCRCVRRSARLHSSGGGAPAATTSPRVHALSEERMFGTCAPVPRRVILSALAVVTAFEPDWPALVGCTPPSWREAMGPFLRLSGHQTQDLSSFDIEAHVVRASRPAELYREFFTSRVRADRPPRSHGRVRLLATSNRL